MLRTLVFGLLLAASSGPLAHGQRWAEKMFKTTSHDFGAVARGSKAEFAFEFQNIYEEEIHISSVRTSCRCTEPKLSQDRLKTWEKATVTAVFNTRAFLGHRSATLTVTIDEPYYAEVRLRVKGYIRSDVVFHPGEVSFGEVEPGTAHERTVAVAYAGRSDWEILDVRSANEHYEVELIDEQRQSRRVNYKMVIRLKEDAPEGYFQDPLTIVTNDARMSTLELPVTGRVSSPLTLSPASLFLGVLRPGQSVTKKLVLRGSAPFRILSIDCSDAGFSFKAPDRAAKLHLIPVSYTAGDEPAKIASQIRIETDFRDGTTVSCTATASIVGEEVAKQ